MSLAPYAVALALVFAGADQAAQKKTKPATHKVAIDGMKFVPEVLTVKPGDIVEWTNREAFPHTATSKAGGFDSKEIATAKSWKFTATKTGTFPYVCTLHPTMKGTLQVK